MPVVAITLAERAEDLPDPGAGARREASFTYLYILEAENGEVKIGLARRPRRRARRLSTTSGRILRRAASAGPYQHGKRLETALLDQFSEGRIAGSEWIRAKFDLVLAEARLLPEPPQNTSREEIEKGFEDSARGRWDFFVSLYSEDSILRTEEFGYDALHGSQLSRDAVIEERKGRKLIGSPD